MDFDDEVFDRIVQEAIERMERVECSMDEYLAGLKAARSRFDDMVQMVKREIALEQDDQ